MGEAEDHTEPAADFVDVPDRRDEIVGRADDGETGALRPTLGRAVEEDPRIIDVDGARSAQGPHVVLVVPAM